MTNAELIKTLRWCGSDDERHEMCVDESYRCPMWNEDRMTDYCKADIMLAAADALEAAEQRIAELEDDLRNSTISNPERFKIYEYTVKDLILFADLCKRNDVRESDLKQAAWNLELAVRAVMNERAEIVKNTMDEITMRFTPDFEKEFEEMMPINPKRLGRMEWKFDGAQRVKMPEIKTMDIKEWKKDGDARMKKGEQE